MDATAPSKQGLSIDPTATTVAASDTLASESALLSPQASAPLSPQTSLSRTLTAQSAKSPEAKARYRLQEAQLSVPRHRDALRRAIQEGERWMPENELEGARVMLEEEDRKYEAYANVRSAMAGEDVEALRLSIQAGVEAGLGSEDLGPAMALLSNEDFLLARIKKLNTTLEIQHSSPTARDRSKVSNNAREKLNASQSLPNLRSQDTLELQSPSGKGPIMERFEWTATQEDGKLGFTPAWSSLPMIVKVVQTGTWAERVGVTVGDEVDSVNGIQISGLDKAAIMEAFKARPVSIAFLREKDNTEEILNQIKEHIERTHGKKALKPKKRIPGLAWDGRVTGMSLQEYRERKWSVDACYAKVERRGAIFSIRGALPSQLVKNTGHQDLVLDALRGYRATLPTVPSWSCAKHYHPVNSNASPGPGEYHVISCMDPNKHPSIPKHTGPRFGTEVLEPRDPPGPAPGDYDPNAIVHSSTIKKSRVVVIQGREAWRPRTEAPGPGVGEYKYEQANRNGKLTPLQFTIQGRNEPSPDGKGMVPACVSPGPPHYFRSSGCAEKGDKKQPVPGSTWHLPQQNYKPTKNQAPIWKFGSEPRGLRN